MKTNKLKEWNEQKMREMLQGHHLETLISLALATGMRRDELLHVQWQHIDLERRELCVQTTKTRKGDRLITISEESATMLKQHQMGQMEAPLEAGSDWQNLHLVFPNQVGGYLKPRDCEKEWAEMLKQGGFPRLGFHDLRLLVGQRLYQQFREKHDGM
jgi:integrase